MQDYYIRTPEHDDSRGPFNVVKLQSLVEAGQVDENTLYYDEEKEEWIPIALNEALKAEVFPKRERLSLRIEPQSAEDDGEEETGDAINVESMLAAADGETEETKHLKKKRESFERAIAISPVSLAIMMFLSGAFLLIPHLSIVQEALGEAPLSSLLNYPFLLIAFLDLILGVALLLAVTEVFPFVRGRAMLTLGFGLYLGWAIGDPELLVAFALAAIGPFTATLAQRFSLMVLAVVLGIIGNAFLVFLSLNGRFEGFFEVVEVGLGG